LAALLGDRIFGNGIAVHRSLRLRSNALGGRRGPVTPPPSSDRYIGGRRSNQLSVNRQKFVHYFFYCGNQFWRVAIRRDRLASPRRCCLKIDKITGVLCCLNALTIVSLGRVNRRSSCLVFRHGRCLYFRNKCTFRAEAIGQRRSALASDCGLCHFRHFPSALDAIAAPGTEAAPRLKKKSRPPAARALPRSVNRRKFDNPRHEFALPRPDSLSASD
jgi:hypothetical protein